MLIRFGLAHVAVTLAAFGVFALLTLLVVVPLAWLLERGEPPPTPGADEQADQYPRPWLENLHGLLFLGCCVLPFVFFALGTTVWVIDGASGQLSARRYLLYGAGAEVEGADGTAIPCERAADGQDVVVNASTAWLRVAETTYGRATPGPRLAVTLRPGQACAAGRVEALGPPKSEVEASKAARSVTLTFITEATPPPADDEGK